MCELCDALRGMQAVGQAENILQAQEAVNIPLSPESLKEIFEKMPNVADLYEELLAERDRYTAIFVLLMATKNEEGLVRITENTAISLFDKLDENRTLIGMMAFVLGKARDYVLNLDQ